MESMNKMMRLKPSGGLAPDPGVKDDDTVDPYNCTVKDIDPNMQLFFMLASKAGCDKVFKARIPSKAKDGGQCGIKKEDDPLQGLVDMKNLPDIKPWRVPPRRVEKDAEKALHSRQLGNGAFVKRDLPAALRHYNDSLRFCPVVTDDEQTDLALAFGNRSAVLFELGRYKECVTDIARAVLAGYPKEKYDRLLNRRRKCMDILTTAKVKAEKHGNHAEHESEDEQQQTSQKRPEQQSERDSGTGGGDADQDQTKRELTVDFDKRYESPLPELSDKPDDNFWNMSCALELKSDGEKGRHFAAKRDIAPGEILIVEPPYSTVLDGKFWKTHCQQCLERTDMIIPCPTCGSVVFCSEECRDLASRYHYLECPLIDNLEDSLQLCIRVDILRQITKHPAVLLKEMLPKLNEIVDLHRKDSAKLASKLPNPPLSNDDVENCFSLMSHLTQRTTKENFYEYALSALYLFKLLESTTYFDPLSHLGCAGRDKPNNEDLDEVESDVDCQQESNELDQFKDVVLKLLFVGCLIRSTNTYTIVEDKLHYPDLWDSDRIRLGAGLFPLSSFLNHSCDPNTTRDFAHGCVIVAASCPIKRGQEITALYYKTFQDAPLQQRREYLKNCYIFDCECVACREEWPTGAEMQRDYRKSLVCCPKCLKIQRMGDPLTLSTCPTCQANLASYADALSNAWSAVLKTFARVEKGDKDMAKRAPYVMAEFLKINNLLVLPPCGDYHFAKGLFCRSLRIVRGLAREARMVCSSETETKDGE